MSDFTIAAPRHPIQGLLDEVDALQVFIAVPDGYGGVMPHPVELDDEARADFKDKLMSAYATGVTKSG